MLQMKYATEIEPTKIKVISGRQNLIKVVKYATETEPEIM